MAHLVDVPDPRVLRVEGGLDALELVLAQVRDAVGDPVDVLLETCAESPSPRSRWSMYSPANPAPTTSASTSRAVGGRVTAIADLVA